MSSGFFRRCFRWFLGAKPRRERFVVGGDDPHLTEVRVSGVSPYRPCDFHVGGDFGHADVAFQSVCVEEPFNDAVEFAGSAGPVVVARTVHLEDGEFAAVELQVDAMPVAMPDSGFFVGDIHHTLSDKFVTCGPSLPIPQRTLSHIRSTQGEGKVQQTCTSEG